MEPSIWFRAASGLRMRPASMAETTRETRSRASSGCQVTSTKCAPNECFERVGFSFGGKVPSARPKPLTAPWPRARSSWSKGTAWRLPSRLPPCLRRSAAPRPSRRRRERPGCRPRARPAPPRRGRWPPGSAPPARRHHRAAGDRPRWKLRVAQRDLHAGQRDRQQLRRHLRHDRVGAGADVLHRRGDPHRSIVAQIDRGAAGKAFCDPGAGGHAPAERQAVPRHAADARVAPGPAEALGPQRQALLEVPGREGQAEALVDRWLVPQAQGDRVHVERDGEFVHRRFQSEQARHRAGAPHGGRRADAALRQPARHAQVRRVVHVRRSLAAILFIVVEHRGGVDVVVPQARQPPVALGAEADALRDRRPLADGMEHHRAAQHQLHRPAELPCRGRGERRMRPGEQLVAEA